MSQSRIGRVVRVDAKVCHVDLGGERILAAPRGTLFEDRTTIKNPITVGDMVEVSLEGDPPGIERVLPRRNYLGRVASSHDPREQVLVANVDQLCLIGSLESPGFSSNRTDRILGACIWHDIPFVLVLNKIDLASEEACVSIRATYEKVPVTVLETCARDGRGVAELRERLKDRVSVFYGPSGAGKSTLLNRVQPGLDLKEGKISKYWKQGRHTTSHSELHPLASGGWVIDTPGIRLFRLHGLDRGALRSFFPDFAPFSRACRYPDCSHDNEPDCAVFEAVDRRELAASRYASYLEMLEELEPGRTPPEPEEGELADEEE
jgi:ribosome biogenesis GTPase